MIILLFIITHQLPESFCAPGGQITKVVSNLFHGCRFLVNPCGGAQHDILDNFYMEYFDPNSNNENEIRQQTEIYTLLYMLHWKLEQNSELLNKLIYEGKSDGEMGKEKKRMNLFETIRNRLNNLHVHGPMTYRSSLNESANDFYAKIMCKLLKIKHEIFRALSANRNDDSFIESVPKCNNLENSLASVQRNKEQILEWMLSDMMHFFLKRKKLNKFLKEVTMRNDETEKRQIMRKFTCLFGVPRMAMICNYFGEILQFFCVQDLNFYTYLYTQFFEEPTKLGKWRVKIIMDKFLYDEWAKKTFDAELFVVKQIMTANGNEWDEIGQKRAFIVDELLNCWVFYADLFWFKERIIRAKIGQFARESKGKTDKMKKLLLNEQLVDDGRDKSPSLFWENGPEDVTLLRALSICIEEKFAKIHRIEAMENEKAKLKSLKMFSETFLGKFVLCLGDNLKQKKKDKLVTKMHFDKIGQIIGDQSQNGDENRKVFANYERKLNNLLTKDESKQISQILATENNFYSTNEKFNSSDDEEKEENFADAFENFNGKNDKTEDKMKDKEIFKNIENENENRNGKNEKENREKDEKEEKENGEKENRKKVEKENGEKENREKDEKENGEKENREKDEKEEKENGEKENREKDEKENGEKENREKDEKENGEKENRKKENREKDEKENGEKDGTSNGQRNEFEKVKNSENFESHLPEAEEIKMNKKKYFIKSKRNYSKMRKNIKEKENEQKSAKNAEENPLALTPKSQTAKNDENKMDLKKNGGDKGLNINANLSPISLNRSKSAKYYLPFRPMDNETSDFFEFKVRKASKFSDDVFLYSMYEQLIDLIGQGNSEKIGKIENPMIKSLLRVIDIGIYVNEIYHRIDAKKRLKGILENNLAQLNPIRICHGFDGILATISEIDLSKGADAKNWLKKLHLGLRQIENGTNSAEKGKNEDELEDEIRAISNQIHTRKFAKFVLIAEQKNSPINWEKTDEKRKMQILLTIMKTENEKKQNKDGQNEVEEEKVGRNLVKNFEQFKNKYKKMDRQRKLDKSLLTQYQNDNSLLQFVEEGIRKEFLGAEIERFAEDLQEIKFTENKIKEKIMLPHLKKNKFKENNDFFTKALNELQQIFEEWSDEARLQVTGALMIKYENESFSPICFLPGEFNRAKIFGNLICDYKKRTLCQDESLCCIFCKNLNVSLVQKFEKDPLLSVPTLKIILMTVQINIQFITVPTLKHLPIGNFNGTQIRRISKIFVENIKNLLENDNFDECQHNFELKKLNEEKYKLTKQLSNASEEKSDEITEKIENTKKLEDLLTKFCQNALNNREKVKELKAMLAILMEFGNDIKVLENIWPSNEEIYKEKVVEIKKRSDLKVFVQSLAYLEKWAIDNYIFNSELGYLDSNILKIMLSKVFAIYPNSSALFIIHKFFLTFSLWHWPLPVQLEQLTYEQSGELLMMWSPGREWVQKKQSLKSKSLRKRHQRILTMPIIGPMFPQQNLGHKINSLTAKVIQRKMQEALEQTLGEENSGTIIEPLEPTKFSAMYTVFIHFICTCPHFIVENFCDFVRIQISQELPNFIHGILGDYVDYLHYYPANLNITQNFGANENKQGNSQ
ncbi:hypothetical protein niasHT_012026 [Heterodera trifolii]|uniref:polynucleotide adenylyltransferase n=1 Tax=Heterodera trifolii TaxID=157864 RepID=A0ABD2KUR4_9BILA